MEIVLLTALGVGGATVIGAVLGFIFKNISHRHASFFLLISLAQGGEWCNELCVNSCPTGAISINPLTIDMAKCTL